MKTNPITNLSVAIMAAFTIICFAACSSDNGPNVDEVDDSNAVEPTVLQLTNKEANTVDQLNQLSFDMNTSVAGSFADANGPANYTFSPLSVETNLSLIANSLDEPQRSKILKMLGYDNLDELNAFNAKLYKYLCDKGNGVEMNLASSVWHDNAYSLNSHYTTEMDRIFNAEVYRKDFASPLTVTEINTWAAEKTKNMIDRVLEEMPDQKLLWINAMYFFGRWDEPFDKNATDRQKFNGISGSKNVDMMHKQDIIAHSEVNSWQMVSLPFKTLAYQCMFILPTSTASISDFNADIYDSLLGTLKGKEVTLSLPRFKIKSEINLKSTLSELGMPDKGLRFTSMGLPESYVQSGLSIGQAAKIELDEEGARLAAVTQYLATSTGEIPQYEKVKVDFNRPFIFVVRHMSSGAILMIGRVCDI